MEKIGEWVSEIDLCQGTASAVPISGLEKGL
jgi:hypothetical protein